MMRTLTSAALTGATLFAAPAQAQDEDFYCSAYSICAADQGCEPMTMAFTFRLSEGGTLLTRVGPSYATPFRYDPNKRSDPPSPTMVFENAEFGMVIEWRYMGETDDSILRITQLDSEGYFNCPQSRYPLEAYVQ